MNYLCKCTHFTNIFIFILYAYLIPVCLLFLVKSTLCSFNLVFPLFFDIFSNLHPFHLPFLLVFPFSNYSITFQNEFLDSETQKSTYLVNFDYTSKKYPVRLFGSLEWLVVSSKHLNAAMILATNAIGHQKSWEVIRTQRTEGRINLNFQAHPYGVAFLNPWYIPN